MSFQATIGYNKSRIICISFIINFNLNHGNSIRENSVDFIVYIIAVRNLVVLYNDLSNTSHLYFIGYRQLRVLWRASVLDMPSYGFILLIKQISDSLHGASKS